MPMYDLNPAIQLLRLQLYISEKNAVVHRAVYSTTNRSFCFTILSGKMLNILYRLQYSAFFVSYREVRSEVSKISRSAQVQRKTNPSSVSPGPGSPLSSDEQLSASFQFFINLRTWSLGLSQRTLLVLLIGTENDNSCIYLL